MNQLGKVDVLGIKDLGNDDYNDKSVVIIDTNFLLSIGELKIDIFSDIDKAIHEKYRFIILDIVLRELDNLIDISKGKKKFASKLAKQILESRDHILLEGYSYNDTADESIMDFISDYRKEVSDKNTIYIATQDKGLRIKILKNIKNTKFLKIRQEKYVVLE